MTSAVGSKWTKVALGVLAECRNGINYNKDNFGKGIKVINVKDFQDYSIASFEVLDEVNPSGVIKEKDLLKNGDIIFVRSNGNRELIGRSLFIQGIHEPITHSAFTIKLRFTSNRVLPRFYAYLFRTSIMRQTLSAHGNGTNISNLNQGILTHLQVPLPPLLTQQKIVEILSAYDRLIENNTRRIKILEEMARSLYEEWFVKFRSPGYEQTEMVDSELELIPEGWQVVNLRDVSSYINRGISPKYDDQSTSIVINQKCIRDCRLNLDLVRRQCKKVPQEKFIQFGDVLVNSTGIGTLGRVAQVYQNISECTVDSHVSIVRPIESINIDYFGFSLFKLQAYFDHSGVGSTGQTELSRESIANAEFLLPPKELQQAFGQAISPMRHTIINLFAKNANLRKTRDLLLPKLISGEIDVENLDIETEAINENEEVSSSNQVAIAG